MPPLYHKLPDEDFDISESEVIAWIAGQSDILDLARDRARWHGLIVFNKNTGKWQGVDYDDWIFYGNDPPNLNSPNEKSDSG